jgi:hypothetical protein
MAEIGRLLSVRFSSASLSPMVLVSASGVVVASPVSSHRMFSGATAVSDHVVRAAYRPAAPVDSADGNYVAGLPEAVPSLVTAKAKGAEVLTHGPVLRFQTFAWTRLSQS